MLSVFRTLGVLGTELSEHLDGAVAGVLDEGAGDDLHGFGDGAVRPLCYSLDELASLLQSDGNGHLCCAASGAELRVPDYVPCYAHGVVEVSLDLVQNILGRASQQNCAGLGILALGEEREVLVTNLGDLEKPTLGSDIRGSGREDGVDNGSAGCTRNTVVVCFPDTADSCDVVLDEEMLCEIYNTGLEMHISLDSVQTHH